VDEPRVNLNGILVVDNVARGPSVGGIRMAPDVTLEECFRLARAMTLKNAAADLPHGGGKVVVIGDPRMPKEKKEPLIRALAYALRKDEEYIYAPDMGTNEECMAWIHDEVGRVVGLPREVGGIPLDEVGATGFGLRHATDVALRYCDFKLEGARLVVQGFGAVGYHAARFLTRKGALLIGVADSRGAIHNPQGLNLNALYQLKHEGKSVKDFPDGKSLKADEIIDIECDIWIPAARPDVIHEENVDRLKTKLVVQGANIPISHGAEQILHERGIICIPDFIANAGGVICAATEYKGLGENEAFRAIEEKIRRNTLEVLEDAKNRRTTPRQAAVEMATRRVKTAMAFRRFNIM
jgi:glutamate dehydrogenase (NAD(P)+)